MKTYLYPYKMASEGAKELSKEAGWLRVKKENSKFKGSPEKVVVNWGSSSLPDHVKGSNIVNQPESVGLCSNKIKTLRALDEGGVPCVEWTTDKQEAIEWFKNGNAVFARTLTKSHSGKGIVDCDPLHSYESDIPDANLYTKYLPKKDEFRVHMVGFKPISVTRKAVKRTEEMTHINWRIRTHNNGFIFQRKDVEYDESVVDVAISATKALDIEICAVDILWNQSLKKAVVVEVNAAPGLTGTTVSDYTKAIEEYIKETYGDA